MNAIAEKLPEVIQATDVTVIQPSPMELAQSFLQAGGDLATLKEMMSLQREHDAYQAKKAYTKAMAEFKADPPVIVKDKRVGFTSKKTGDSTNYSHASLGNVTKQINKGLGEHGFSVAWPLEQTEKGIKVSCVITHELGHSENTSLFAESDNTGQKNVIQAMGSTISYLQRYTVLALTGLATEDQDDDGAGSQPVKLISEKQLSTIVDMINATETDEIKFLGWIGAKSVETIPQHLFNKALSGLKARVKS